MKTLNLTSIIRPDLLDLEPYSSARNEFEGNASVFLDANENPFDNGMNRYPDPLQEKLKQRISELKKVDPEKLFLGNGSDECIDLILRLFCISNSDKAAAISPSYGMYKVSARINSIELVELLLNEDFSLDIERILKDSKDCKVLFICSPNNPTGQSFPKSQLEEIVRRFNGIVVIDEAYVDFSENGSMIGSIDKYPNLAVAQTFSKAFGMAGARLGMLFGSKELITWLNKIKPPYNINQLTQDFVLNKLMDVTSVYNEINVIIEERKKLVRELSELTQIQVVYPSDSNFILIKVFNAEEVYRYLINNGIVVRNRSNLAMCSNTLRITVGTPEENIKLITSLKSFRNQNV